jgi:chitin disaccharide deacetylase
MQLERVLAAGIRPTHLDSHHHSHTEWAIAPLVCRLARDYGIRRIRLTRNMGPVPSRAKRWYKKVFNYRFLGRRSGLVDNTDYFGDIADMNYFLNAGGGARANTGVKGRVQGLSVEIMVHPLFDPAGRLVDYDGKDLRQELLPILALASDI